MIFLYICEIIIGWLFNCLRWYLLMNVLRLQGKPFSLSALMLNLQSDSVIPSRTFGFALVLVSDVPRRVCPGPGGKLHFLTEDLSWFDDVRVRRSAVWFIYTQTKSAEGTSTDQPDEQESVCILSPLIHATCMKNVWTCHNSCGESPSLFCNSLLEAHEAHGWLNPDSNLLSCQNLLYIPPNSSNDSVSRAGVSARRLSPFDINLLWILYSIRFIFKKNLSVFHLQPAWFSYGMN